MSATAGSVLVAMFLLIAFFYGVILWQREGALDRLTDDVDDLKREVGLMLGRERNRDAYLGIEVNDPVPDGPGDPQPWAEGEWAPRAMEQPSLIQVSDAEPEPEAAHSGSPDDDTDEIPVCPPTVPDMKAAAKVAPLPSVDADWEVRRAEIEAEWKRAAAEIGGGR